MQFFMLIPNMHFFIYFSIIFSPEFYVIIQTLFVGLLLGLVGLGGLIRLQLYTYTKGHREKKKHKEPPKHKQSIKM